MVNSDTYYTSFSIAKEYLKKRGYILSNFDLSQNAPDRCIMWVDENETGCTHFNVIKISQTQFLIWEFDANGFEILSTSIDKIKPK